MTFLPIVIPLYLFCLSMISAQTLRVCREGKPVPTPHQVQGRPFPDHASAWSRFELRFLMAAGTARVLLIRNHRLRCGSAGTGGRTRLLDRPFGNRALAARGAGDGGTAGLAGLSPGRFRWAFRLSLDRRSLLGAPRGGRAVLHGPAPRPWDL